MGKEWEVFMLGPLKYEIALKHPNENIEVEVRRVWSYLAVWATNINLGVIGLSLVFQTIRRDEITEKVRRERNRS